MNTSNKFIILSLVFCISTFAILGLSFIKQSNKSGGNTGSEPDSPRAEVKNAESNISPKLGETETKEKYLIRLTDGEIRAYIVDSKGGELLWNSIKIPPDLSEEEKSKLEGGIYTESFEELCLYFEAYAS